MRGQIADEIRAVLADGEPMTTAEIFAGCNSADEASQVSRVLYDLRQRGEIEMLDPRVGQSAKRYRLTDDARLRIHLEREQEASAELDAEGPVRTRLCAADDRPLNSADGASEGDEFTSAGTALQYGPDSVRLHVRPAGLIDVHWPDAMELPDAGKPAKRQHFIARLIESLPAPEPRVLDAAIWAAAFGALAARLERGQSIPPDPELISALREYEKGALEVAA